MWGISAKCETLSHVDSKVQKKNMFLRKKKTEIPFSTIRKMCSSCGCILEQKQDMSNIRGSKIVLVNLSHNSPRFQGENPSEFITKTPSCRGQLDSRWAPSLIVINGGDMRSPTQWPPQKKWVSVGDISTLWSWSDLKKVHKKLDFWGNSTSVKKL